MVVSAAADLRGLSKQQEGERGSTDIPFWISSAPTALCSAGTLSQLYQKLYRLNSKSDGKYIKIKGFDRFEQSFGRRAEKIPALGSLWQFPARGFLCYKVRMLQIRKVDKFFADRCLFAEINLHIRPADRIGLCGENGAGKTTLLKMLAGKVSPDAGELQVARGTSFGYLPQDGLEHRGVTLFQEVRSALSELLALEQELTGLEQAIATSGSEAQLERYAEAQELFQQRGGYTMEAEIGKVLRGLGFAESDWEKPCEQFSGGWQMRIALAKLLLQRPNLLLLDEPTNHLDLQQVFRWLADAHRAGQAIAPAPQPAAARRTDQPP